IGDESARKFAALILLEIEDRTLERIAAKSSPRARHERHANMQTCHINEGMTGDN
ncbi:jg21128, partial [Pararge aegeria aegeria]